MVCNKIKKLAGVKPINYRIALVGKRGAGKDYVAEKLKNRMGFTVLSFSDKLKEIAKHIYPWMDNDYSPETKEKPLNHKIENGRLVEFSPREIWNMLDMLRIVDDYVFIRDVMEKIDDFPDCHFLVKDVRKIDEYNMLRKRKFKFVYVFSDFSPKILDEHDKIVERLFQHQCDYNYVNKRGDENFDRLVDFIEKL